MENNIDLYSIKVRITEVNSLKSERFIIRDLSNRDVNERYLSWIKDKTSNKFIEASSASQDIAKLRSYVRERSNLDIVRFFGIFDKISKRHIGNIKYEPINIDMNYAIMGVLIGEIPYRGIGVFNEVYSLSSQYIRSTYNIKKIFLGVDQNNIAAIKSYIKSGFFVTNDHPTEVSGTGLVMVQPSQSMQS